MRTLVSLDNPQVTHDVYEHIITRNLWEFYVGKPDSNGIAFAFVMGFENEFGDVPLSEILPHSISRVKVEDDTELAPAVGFKWENDL